MSEDREYRVHIERFPWEDRSVRYRWSVRSVDGHFATSGYASWLWTSKWAARHAAKKNQKARVNPSPTEWDYVL